MIYILTIYSLLLTLFIVLKYFKRRSYIKEQQSIKNQRIKNKLIPDFLARLQSANTLLELYAIHIQIWANNIRNKNIGPDSYGMFRTHDILTMSPHEVYLGNIWGLFTYNIPTWQSFEDSELVKLVTKQYKDHLINNLKTIQNGLL